MHIYKNMKMKNIKSAIQKFILILIIIIMQLYVILY